MGADQSDTVTISHNRTFTEALYGEIAGCVSYLVEKEIEGAFSEPDSAFQTMLASEAVLKRDWELPEEDEAWTSL